MILSTTIEKDRNGVIINKRVITTNIIIEMHNKFMLYLSTCTKKELLKIDKIFLFDDVDKYYRHDVKKLDLVLHISNNYEDDYYKLCKYINEILEFLLENKALKNNVELTNLKEVL